MFFVSKNIIKILIVKNLKTIFGIKVLQFSIHFIIID